MKHFFGLLLGVWILYGSADAPAAQIIPGEAINQYAAPGGVGWLPIGRDFPYSPFGVYRFEESLASTALDRSGKGNHGTLTGTGTTRVSGNSGTALQFNPSSSGEVVVSDVAVTNQFSLSVWLKLGTTTPTSRHAISRHPGWFLSGNPTNGMMRFAVKTATEVSINFDTFANIGVAEWHHYAAVYDGSMIHTYLDGQWKNGGTQSGNIDTSGQTRLGGYWNNSTSLFTWNGSVDEVIFCDRAFGTETIQRLYGKGR